MEDSMNGYRLLEPFQNRNAGFSRWTSAQSKGKIYFLKEFMNPVYPDEETLDEKMVRERVKTCLKYEEKKRRLYEMIDIVSDGNLISIQEFFRYSSHYYIATEFIESEMLTFKEIAVLPLVDKLLLCSTIAHGISRLHQAHIVHADIKKENILLKRSVTGKIIAKVIDFDCSFFENIQPESGEELGGDMVYLAPEACRFICGEKVDITTKIDVFALGILFHQYFTGELPYYDKENYFYAHEAVLDGGKLEVSDKIPKQYKDVIVRMLEPEPLQRIDMKEVFQIFSGNKITEKCSQCGAVLHPKARFCSKCGAEVAQ